MHFRPLVKIDPALRFLALQGAWMSVFFVTYLGLYLTRPRYAPTATYEAAHQQWETTMETVGGFFLVVSLAMTSQYVARRQKTRQKA